VAAIHPRSMCDSNRGNPEFILHFCNGATPQTGQWTYKESKISRIEFVYPI
jgi:hypothetical protein